MKRILFFAGAMLLLASAGFAIIGVGSTMQMTPEAVTQGGGNASSASFKSDQQAIGQSVIYSQSASYQNHGGVVQPPAGTSTSVQDWEALND